MSDLIHFVIRTMDDDTHTIECSTMDEAISQRNSTRQAISFGKSYITYTRTHLDVNYEMDIRVAAIASYGICYNESERS